MKSNQTVAWEVSSKCDDGGMIVFAKTREKARQIALKSGEFDNSRYTDMQVYRAPQMDKYYKRGKEIMDFSNPADRLALVRDAGFRCLEYNFENDCAKCNAKNFCDIWAKGEETW